MRSSLVSRTWNLPALALACCAAIGLPGASPAFDGFNVNSATFDYRYDGNQIWDGVNFLNDWSQAGGASVASLALDGSALVSNNDANNGWLQQDSGSSPWEGASGNWTLELSAKLTDVDADPENIVIWADAGGSRIIIRVGADDVGYDTGGADLVSGVDNTDGFNTFRVAFDAGNPTAGPDGTYHVWRNDVLISGAGVARTASAGTTTRLIVGDCCSSIGNPVDQFEIAYVRYDLDGAFSPVGDQGELALQINRDTGEILLGNSTGAAVSGVIGYSLRSAAGGLSQAGWSRQADGSALANDNDQWSVLSAPGVANDLSEAVFQSTGDGNGGDLPAANGSWSYGAVWRKSPFEDVVLELLLDDGSILSTAAADFSVSYVGNGDAPFAFGDLDYDGDVDPADWKAFKDAYRGTDLAALGSADGHGVELYNAGDLNRDGNYTLADFRTFVQAYDAANGAGAFAAIGVPEPAAVSLLALGGIAMTFARKRRQRSASMHSVPRMMCVAALVGSAASAASALDKLDSAAFDNRYNGNQIWNGAAFLNQWSQAGGATAAALSLNGTNLVQSNDAANGWVQQDDADSSPWELGSGSYTVELSAKVNDVSAEVANGFTLWAELGGAGVGNRQILWVQDDSINLLDGAELIGGIDNTSGFNTLRLAYDAEDFTAGPQGTYHAWWNGLRITGEGIARQAAATVESRLIVGDCCSSLGNPVDPFEIAYVRYDMDGAYEPEFLAELKLVIDTGTGSASIVNQGSPIDFQLNSYSITSAGSSLTALGWSSLQDQGLAVDPTPGDKNNGDSWEEFTNVGASFLGEGYLLGSSLVAAGESLSLGSLFVPGSAQDLQFSFTAVNGGLLEGSVEYVTGTGFAADFNNDGKVDGADYAQWQGDFGVNGDSDANNDGRSGGADLLVWQRQFGSAAASATVVGVPEPTTAGLWCLAGASLWFGRRVRSRQAAMFCIAACTLAASSQCATAKVFNDRFYSLGDLSNIGYDTQGVNLEAFPGAIDSGAYQDLNSHGGVSSVEVGPAGLKRPGLTAAAKGAQFDGLDDAFTTSVSLNSPHQTWNFAQFFPTALIPPDAADDGQYDPPSATGSDGPDPDTSYTPAFPHNYSGIFSRGIQLWARPTGLGQMRRQDLVMDTNQHGVFITEVDTWGLQFDGPPTSAPNNGSRDTGVEVASTLDANGWAHVMQLSGLNDLQGGGSAFAGALLVNGVAVGATNTFYDPETSGLSIGSNLANDGNYYAGTLDDVRVFIWGDNSQIGPTATKTELGYLGGANWGTLDLGTDNDWIRLKLASMGVTSRGDVDLDGNLDGDDVAAFVANWRAVQLVDGVQVGDWNSRQQGDLNYNGVVDLADAYILHEALQGVGSALNFSLLAGAVPEPNAVALAAIAALGGCAGRRRAHRSAER